MRANFTLCLVILTSIAVFGADKPGTLSLKEGLWEVTVTNPSGMGAMPADALAKMPPEQRARVEEMMKQKGISMNGNTTVVKNCITKEKIDKGIAFATSNKEERCTHTFVNSSSSHYEAKFHCDKMGKDDKTVDGTTTVDIVNGDNIKGSTHIVTSGKGQDKDKDMTMDMTFTSKYLGASCGDIK
jgi:hypothetical protein